MFQRMCRVTMLAVHPLRFVSCFYGALLREIPNARQLQILAVEAERRILLVRRRPNIPLYGSEGKNAGIVVVIVLPIVSFELHVLPDPADDGVVHRQGLYVSMQAGFR